MNPVDIKQVDWWRIKNSDTKAKYRKIERSFAGKLGKYIRNIAYFALLSNDVAIQFTGERMKCYHKCNDAMSIFYDGLYPQSFWYHITVLVDLTTLAESAALTTSTTDNLVIEKHVFKLIDMTKKTLSEIKQLLGNTDEEIKKHYKYYDDN